MHVLSSSSKVGTCIYPPLQIYYFCGDSVLAYDASALLWTPVEGIHPALTLTGGKALAIGSSAAYASAKWNVTESIVKFEVCRYEASILNYFFCHFS